MATRPTERTPADYFPTMIRIASDVGCQLEQAPDNPTLLRGFCPFHEADSPRAARTLQINTRSTRFWCLVCSAEGNPIAFASMIWGLSAVDAHQMLADDSTTISSRRPPYPTNFFDPPQDRPHTPRPQNSAMLTRATRYYADQLFTNYPPLQFLARMAVTPQEAAGAGVGFCPGGGLREFLADQDTSPQELQDTPLINAVTGMETFTGRITISDKDFTGAATWMTSLMPEEPTPKMEWRARRPSTYGIPGLRSYLVNLYCLSRRNTGVVVTDDARLYIVLATNAIPCTLITQRNRPESDPATHAQRIARAVTSRGARQVSIAVHDRNLRALTIEALRETLRQRDVTDHGRLAIMNAINPLTRDLDILRPGRQPSPAGQPSDPGQQPPASQPRPEPEEDTTQTGEQSGQETRAHQGPDPTATPNVGEDQNSPAHRPETNGAQDQQPPPGTTREEPLAQPGQGHQQNAQYKETPTDGDTTDSQEHHPAQQDTQQTVRDRLYRPSQPASQGNPTGLRPSGATPQQKEDQANSPTPGPQDSADLPPADPQHEGSTPEPAQQSGRSSG